MVGISIREQDPLKQGLKQIFSTEVCPKCQNSWARSTKTRIETHFLGYITLYGWHSWARSTKTRIETAHFPEGSFPRNPIREQDPLKQGLKRSMGLLDKAKKTDSWARSTKTRIETFHIFFTPLKNIYSWARSTKTRIETPKCFVTLWTFSPFVSKIH